MAICSSSLSTTRFPVCNSSATISTKPKLSVLSLPSNSVKLQALLQKPTRLLISSVRAVADVLATEETTANSTGLEDEAPGVETLSVGADSDRMAPKQKIRIKLRSYWVPLIEDSCKQIMDAAKTTNAKTMGPVPLPTKILV